MNNKFILSVSILIFLMFLQGLVCAQEIEIIAPEKPTMVYAGETNTLELLVKNNRDVKDTFYFSVWPTYWIDIKKYWASLDPNEIETVTVTIKPPRDAEEGTHELIFTVKSIDYEISISKGIYFYIKRPTHIFVTEIKINKQTLKPDDTISIQPVLSNIDKKQTMEVFVTTKISKDDLTIDRFYDTVTIRPESTHTLSYVFEIKNTQSPGDYEINTVIRDNLNKFLDEKTIDFKIEEDSNIKKERKTENSILYITKTITITNNGNVVESFHVTESLPIISKNFFYPEIEPVSEEEKDNRIVYKWLIQDFTPGETMVIRYQLRFANVVLISCILIIAIIWVLWLFYKPTLRKKYIGLLGLGRELTISLHLKNRGRKPLNNIAVTDFVPPLAKVIKKFDTLVPSIKRRATGTELTWKIKQLNSKEERVLTYKVKPVIDIVGKLKLPKAHMIYKTKKGKRRRALSKTITVMGKVK